MNKSKLYQNMWKYIVEFLTKTTFISSLEEYNYRILNEIYNYIYFDAAHLISYKNDKISDFKKINISNKVIDDYNSYYKNKDFIIKNFFNKPMATKSSLLIDYRQWKKTEFFNDFLLPNNFYYLCGIDIYHDKNLLTTMTLIRNKKSKDFTTPDLLFLNRISTCIGNHIYLLKKFEKNID